jgi:hypothetical protein
LAVLVIGQHRGGIASLNDVPRNLRAHIAVVLAIGVGDLVDTEVLAPAYFDGWLASEIASA